MCILSMNAHVSTLVLVGAGTCSVCVSVCPVGLHVSSWTLVQEVMCALVQGGVCICVYVCTGVICVCTGVCLCAYVCTHVCARVHCGTRDSHQIHRPGFLVSVQRAGPSSLMSPRYAWGGPAHKPLSLPESHFAPLQGGVLVPPRALREERRRRGDEGFVSQAHERLEEVAWGT